MAKKDSFYFSHDYNAANDYKILFLRQQLGMEGYGIFWYLVEQLAQSNGKLPLKIVPVLAMQMQVPEAKVNVVIHNFDLFVIDNEHFESERLTNHLEIRKGYSNFGKLGADARWGNRGAIGDANRGANSHPNAKERKGKERKEKKENEELVDLSVSAKPNKGEKAISFSEDGEFAIFACGYKQKLGNIQAEGVKTGWVKPYDVIYNSVY